jgi:hypothetical protein
MKKKFRLIKTYPGSPELGTIALDIGIRWNLLKPESHACYSFKSYNEFNPQQYPEFWEEVIEKDYEIVSLIYTNQPLFKVTNQECVDNLLNSGFKIHSVKRLSDGEIFTIGDKCTKGIINAIYRDNRFSEFHDCALSIGLDSTTGYKLKDLKKSKQPLFTTEDGVDIYEYDAIWVVSSNFNTIYTTAFSNKYGNSKTAYKIVFSNKKAAEEYILWNKPCLSLNDVASIYPGVNKNHSNTPSHQAERLKELVKSKL